MKDLDSQLSNLIVDPDFQFLCNYKKRINLFNIADLCEIKQSKMIAWLLNPSGNHNCGDAFIKKLLFEVINKESDGSSEFDTFRKDYSALDIQQSTFCNAMVFTEFSAGEGKEAVDICLFDEDNALMIFIENKFGANEGPDQRKKYRSYLTKKYINNFYCVYVFMDYYGDSEDKVMEGWTHINYDWVIAEIDQRLLSKNVENKTAEIFKDYFEYLKEEIRDIEIKKELCTRVHKVRRKYNSLFEYIIGDNFTNSNLKAEDYIRYISNGKSTTKSKLSRLYFRHYETFTELLGIGYFEQVANEIKNKIGISDSLIEVDRNYICFTIEEMAQKEEWKEWPVYVMYIERNNQQDCWVGITICTRLLSDDQRERLRLPENMKLLGIRRVFEGRDNWIRMNTQDKRIDLPVIIEEMKKCLHIVNKVFAAD